MEKMNKAKNTSYPYVVMTDNYSIDGVTFWRGVSFEYMERNGEVIIELDGKDYVIPEEYCIRTTRKTRDNNVSLYKHQSDEIDDGISDYIEATKKHLGIDMKLNYSPQFRDGKNPHKDRYRHGDNKKENA